MPDEWNGGVRRCFAKIRLERKTGAKVTVRVKQDTTRDLYCIMMKKSPGLRLIKLISFSNYAMNGHLCFGLTAKSGILAFFSLSGIS